MANDVTVEFTEAELAEVMAKLANEMEEYRGEASPEFRSAFLKICRAAEPTEGYVTTLAAKWYAFLRNEKT